MVPVHTLHHAAHLNVCLLPFGHFFSHLIFICNIHFTICALDSDQRVKALALDELIGDTHSRNSLDLYFRKPLVGKKNRKDCNFYAQ